VVHIDPIGMSASSTPRILLRGARCFVDGRRLRVCRRRERCVRPLLVHPLPSSSSYARAYQTTPQHFPDHRNYLCSRSIQTQPSPECNETNNNNVRQQQHQLLFYEQPIRRPTSDPTVKRPTQKCDPYGLAGKSLSYTECIALISTLEDGWRLSVDPRENSNEEARNHTNHLNNSRSDEYGAISTCSSPIFLQKYYHHPTFHEASKFISHIALLATNHNHFPYLSIERILVEDLHNIYPLGGDTECNLADDSLGINNTADDIRTELPDSGIRKRKVPKVKGWIFRSTVRCSTYRPSTTSNANSHSSQENSRCISFRENITEHSSRKKGLTYHDFHLAMSVDVEVNREDVKRWLVYWSSDEQ
jgi:hypothetical protein